MGIFDVFTGGSAKKAAADNKAVYGQYQTEGMGDLNAGMAGTMPALDSAIGAYTPVAALGTKYGRGSDAYMDALGINGAEGNTRAVDAFHAGPGYQFAVDQATNAGQRAAARFSPGGNEIDAVTRIGAGLADQEWKTHLTNLGGFVPQEASAVSGAAAGQAAGYGAKAGAFATDANNRVNLRGNVAGGIANSNTAAAQAQMNASGQFWNGLMALGGNVAKASMGVPPTAGR